MAWQPFALVGTALAFAGYLFWPKSAGAAIKPKPKPPAPAPPPVVGAKWPPYCVTTDAGASVLEVQQLLQAFGADLAPWGADGKCGDVTHSAIAKFQGMYTSTIGGGYTPGVADKATVAAMRKNKPASLSPPSQFYDTNHVQWTIDNPGTGLFRGIVTGDIPMTTDGTPVAEYISQSVTAPTLDTVKQAINQKADYISSQYPNTTEDGWAK